MRGIGILRSLWPICTAFAVVACGDSGVARETAATAQLATLTGCQSVTHLAQSYTICAYRPHLDDIRLFHSDADGAPYLQFDRLATAVEEDGNTLVFAMNGGMYHEDRRPVGYYRDSFGDQARVNLNDGPGNFHLKPNGVFWLSGDIAGITESAAYLEADIDPDYATQSGPLLLRQRVLHPSINPDGVSHKRRNGVGVTADGATVYFAISDSAVTFYEFATLFRDRLGAQDALFLEGQVSRIYAPQIARNEIGVDLGPIIGVVE